MTDRIIVVTSPDDVYQQGFRLLTVDLTVEQLDEVSNSLKKLDTNEDIIVYVWKVGFDVKWMLDKIYKSNSIIFNADSLNQTLVGFLAGQKNSAYFGELKTIKEVNTSNVFDQTQCTDFLNRFLGFYEQISK